MPSTTLLATGDLNFSADDAADLFAGVAPTLKSGDVVVGHLETPYTLNPMRIGVNRTRAVDPEKLQLFLDTGFNVATLAGNHLWDAGLPGVKDTIDWLDRHGVPRTGAGLDLDEADRPAFMEHNGSRVGVLSLNCTGPREGWAGIEKAGSAYIHVITHYELEHDCPGGSPTVYTFPTYPALEKLKAQIADAKAQCDVLLVALHKGILHTPVLLADFERPLSQFIIDAGADAIVSHHAHITKGVEVYKGKPIFHGLGHLVFPSMARPADTKADGGYMAKRGLLYRFEGLSPRYNYHPEAVHGMIAKLDIENGKVQRAGYVPVMIDADAKARTVGRHEGAQQVFDYLAAATEAAGLNGRFAWDGDDVVVQ